jgi:hypothetical protein
VRDFRLSRGMQLKTSPGNWKNSSDADDCAGAIVVSDTSPDLPVKFTASDLLLGKSRNNHGLYAGGSVLRTALL